MRNYKQLVCSIIIGLFAMFSTSASAEYIANPNPYPVKVSGQNMQMEGYNINDYTYFKLRDIAAVVGGFDVDFQNGAVMITSSEAKATGGTTKGASTTQTALPNPYPVKVNGSTVQIEGYNINDNTYFKLRDVASVVGKFSVDFQNGAVTIDVIGGKQTEGAMSYGYYPEVPWCPDFGTVIGKRPRDYKYGDVNDDEAGYIVYSYIREGITTDSINNYRNILTQNGFSEYTPTENYFRYRKEEEYDIAYEVWIYLSDEAIDIQAIYIYPSSASNTTSSVNQTQTDIRYFSEVSWCPDFGAFFGISPIKSTPQKDGYGYTYSGSVLLNLDLTKYSDLLISKGFIQDPILDGEGITAYIKGEYQVIIAVGEMDGANALHVIAVQDPDAAVIYDILTNKTPQSTPQNNQSAEKANRKAYESEVALVEGQYNAQIAELKRERDRAREDAMGSMSSMTGGYMSSAGITAGMQSASIYDAQIKALQQERDMKLEQLKIKYGIDD